METIAFTNSHIEQEIAFTFACGWPRSQPQPTFRYITIFRMDRTAEPDPENIPTAVVPLCSGIIGERLIDH